MEKNPLPYIWNLSTQIFLSSLFRVHLCYEALLVCIKIKHAEDVPYVLGYCSLLKHRTSGWNVKATAMILVFQFRRMRLQRDVLTICEFVVMFLWLILSNGDIIALRKKKSRSDENTKVYMLQTLHIKKFVYLVLNFIFPFPLLLLFVNILLYSKRFIGFFFASWYVSTNHFQLLRLHSPDSGKRREW